MAKKKKIKKTNEERILDEHGIAYEEKNFNWVGRGQAALEDAQSQGIDPDSLLKTIVLQANADEKDYLVVCLPVQAEINLKLVAHELGKKQVHLADNKKLIKITGYVHGANTPIGISAYKGFPIYFDEQIKSFNEISVSAGKIGRSVRLKQTDLVNLVKGTYIKVER
ncbi:MAG TPA: aminoacyl-tRNA deacylase [Candidatus Ligilactobacillus excrementigallinarum]|uniref:Cys-tRNA(Pro)/Cys-tRNA(Cys) deacylase n=1 Tax=Candidatus Ligilactobacillus excrementigallinarum TaxID=2838641 RepID=A0A9D1UVJ0_9LACO|nr:aminoacyl-tRNA deacylase [Candidatus Ligilactobacillus excrementigallinarum]